MKAPVLAYQNSDDLFILHTDASKYAIGAELLQVQNGVERLIGLALSCSTLRSATIVLPGTSY